MLYNTEKVTLLFFQNLCVIFVSYQPLDSNTFPPKPPQLIHTSPQALVSDPTQAIADSYYSSLREHLHMRSDEANAAAARAVYTPLHGVGGKYALQAFKVSEMQRVVW